MKQGFSQTAQSERSSNLKPSKNFYKHSKNTDQYVIQRTSSLQLRTCIVTGRFDSDLITP